MGSNENLERLQSEHNQSQYLSKIECNGQHDECVPMNRLKNIIKYYNEWEQKQSENTDSPSHGIYEYLSNESENGLTELLQDYHHFVSKHNNEYETIFNDLTSSINAPCNYKNCPMMRRNHRDRSNASSEQTKERRRMYTNNKDYNEVISQQFLDQIHVYMLHQFDMGFKLTKKEENELKNMDSNETKNKNEDCIQTNLEN